MGLSNQNFHIEGKEMAGATKAVRAYNKSLFEQRLIKCSVCKEIKPLDDFCSNSGNWHGKMTRCRPCDQVQTRQREDDRRADLNEIKEAQGCMRCGYNEEGSKLHFHHRDPSTKLFDVGKGIALSPIRLQEEIDKCDLLCISCHSIVEPRTPRFASPISKSTLETIII